MDQIVVQTKHAEMQANGELLVFYVDENGSHQEGVVTAIENIDENSLQQLQHGNYVIEEISDPTIDDKVAQPVVPEHPSNTGTCRWMDDETRKLLIFYIDNKETFLNGYAKKKELWSVACKTMLSGKNPTSCEMKLRNLKRSYSQLCIEYSTGQNLAIWPFYDLCHQAFHDDTYVKMLIKEATRQGRSITSSASLTTAVNDPVVAVQEDPQTENVVEKVDQMLNVYLQTNKSSITTQASLATTVNYPVIDTQQTSNTKTADENIDQMLNMYLQSNKSSITTQASLTTAVNYDVNPKQEAYNTAGDGKVDQMLNIYLQSKKSKRDLKRVWDLVAAQLGEDSDYWYKRFLNYKQHYIRILDKLKESGPMSITWPYIDIFDEIYANDADFKKKYGVSTTFNANYGTGNPNDDWNETEKTVLVKYCFDCFDEFQDATIPNTFLWNEIGKLLDKTGDLCKKKYEHLKLAHIDQYISEQYDLNNRVPIAILFDNIIYKETEIQITKTKSLKQLEKWQSEEIDNLVQFIYNNLEMFKDQMCHFVCWAALSRKLERTLESCLYQWEDLTSLYKSILNDKKEDSDMEVDWRYIEAFDRIFDYGMDTKLLDGYEKPDTHHTTEKKTPGKTGAKESTTAESDEDYVIDEDDDGDGDYIEERTGVGKQFRGVGDSRQFAILEYYFKNKDKFTTQRKLSLWAGLAKQQGLTANQCAHRFRNLKQVYTAYIQREINKPEMPILWPYYSLCKKVFGYRQLKSKLKKSKADNSAENQWAAKEIKQLISFSKNHLSAIDAKPQDISLWGPLALQTGKTQVSCRDKFLELKKAYTKIKTMRRRNPSSSVNWRYFRLFEEVYTGTSVEDMDVDSDDEIVRRSEVQKSEAEQKEDQEDDDYQCIIIMPEDGTIENAKVILKEEPKTKVNPSKRTMNWSYSSKKLLLCTYLKYVKKHDGKIINTSAMWKEIAEKFPKTKRTPWSCNITYAKLKSWHKKNVNDVEYKDTLFCSLFKKIFALKLKFYRQPEAVEDIELTERDTYEDVDVAAWRTSDALKYYHKHITEFISPRYESGYVWKDISNQVGVPVRKLFKKINYLKQLYKNEAVENVGTNAKFRNLTKKILEKEILIRKAIASEPTPTTQDEVSDVTWSDDETERLLQWYLDNLAKFKNPKIVPSYLWMDAGSLLGKTALSCSKKMSEIRTEYSSMVKETPEALSSWKFHELCQKIYGTGKKHTEVRSEAIEISNMQVC